MHRRLILASGGVVLLGGGCAATPASLMVGGTGFDSRRMDRFDGIKLDSFELVYHGQRGGSTSVSKNQLKTQGEVVISEAERADAVQQMAWLDAVMARGFADSFAGVCRTQGIKPLGANAGRHRLEVFLSGARIDARGMAGELALIVGGNLRDASNNSLWYFFAYLPRLAGPGPGAVSDKAFTAFASELLQHMKTDGMLV